MALPRRRLCGLLALSLFGCAQPDSPRGRFAAHGRDQAQALSASGWRGATLPLRVLEQRVSLVVQGRPQNLVLTVPESGTQLPLLLYLPGLGEGAEGGPLWRRAWAAAGYAVLSAQVLVEDEQAWRSELARAGDFAQLGRQRHGDAALQARVQAWQALWMGLQPAFREGEGVWSRLDASRLALAGHDLGASTVLAWLNAQDAPAGTVPSAHAVLLIGASLSQAQLAQSAFRWPEALPVLGVAGTQEHDPSEWAQPEASLRQLFERHRSPMHHLLLLEGASHTVLGAAVPNPNAKTAAAPAARQGAQGGAGGPGGGSRGGRGGAGGGHSRQSGSPGARDAADNAVLPDMSPLPLGDVHAPDIDQALVRGFSLAFLEAALAPSSAARQEASRWLQGAAGPWLGSLGQWMPGG